MWGRNRKTQDGDAATASSAQPLKDAVRQARIDAAERTGVVVDLRDAELARLEILSDALDPVFAEIPADVELFDSGLSKGETPRLWIDAVAHVAMGRDKRIYRFVQDTRFGRKILAESAEVEDITRAVTRYIANRLVERERALAGGPAWAADDTASATRREGPWQALKTALFAIVAGVLAFLIAAWLLASP